jgi:cobalt-zinc-cadmium resistance protein CzcA
MQRGLGAVIVGGLIVATLPTLFILPTLYFVIERFVQTRIVDAAVAREGM